MFSTILSTLQGKTSICHWFDGLFVWILNHLVYFDGTCD